VVWDASENLRDREGAGLDSMMATSRVLVRRTLRMKSAIWPPPPHRPYAALASAPQIAQHDRYQALGALIRGLEKIASAGLQMASGNEHVVAGLATVLDETRIVIEPALKDAGIVLEWEVAASLPLVQGDHHNLLASFLESGPQQPAGHGRP